MLLTSIATQAREQACKVMVSIWIRTAAQLKDQKGQGTTEYAILVGVLVVIAIIAIVAIRGPLQDLWDRIIEAVNSL